jgi:hypothetical protein
VIHRGLESNRFEFAVVAGLRAKQLLAGCVPRVPPADKCTSTARLEVRAGKVSRVAPVLSSAVAIAPQAPSSSSSGDLQEPAPPLP